MQRFDEIELEPAPVLEPAPIVEPPAAAGSPESAALAEPAPRFRRLLALLTDLSLFIALTLALSPLLPFARNMIAMASLGGFVVLTSYYYFAGTWLLWGKSVGGAIFDVKVVSDADGAMSLGAATMRWLGLYLSLLSGGLGFLLAALPGGRSLADRMSGTRCIAAV